MENKKGIVSFVGAGPGDIGLITTKGLECLKQADIILYDRLANPRLLRFAKQSCAFIYCGKLPNRHIMRQENINQSLVQFAKQGKYVVRLKGGDPSVFGRVGEEAEELAASDIPYEIVPGITSSIAAAAYAGIPVTHRNYSNSFTLRTGHACINNEQMNEDKNHTGDTIAYYMGMKKLVENCDELINQGKSLDTKVAIIQWGTLGKQKVVKGTLETIKDIIKKENIGNPAMMIVGDVVALGDSLAWFDNKRFQGKRVVIAKASGSPFDLERYFTELGAEAYSFPVFKKKSKQFSENELETIMNAKKLIFAAPESVEPLFNQLAKANFDIRDLPRNIEYQTVKVKQALAAKGIIAAKAQGSNAGAIVIGPEGYENKEAKLYYSHEWLVDSRFDAINKRLLMEDKWETVIFPNKAAVKCYVEELEKLGVHHLDAIPFAYIGETVKEYAFGLGFNAIDESIQSELERMEWRRGE
ncbi:uroporphyrinogen-III C-methyltransferase [Oceanobacillus profundus]|uniref:uroporphyrinogen-III C-methyltransferase n=1 Tax=Oceanobacillus profundus TaxID=372463 RepID=UPI00203BA893|nr:uroporphyrinogen-III C-methyltransferase [Oceanobacillus profundus]MCM3397719.1 uroporphyrinogen-III C-methyltransferase [Oceanobacillus profundus]